MSVLFSLLAPILKIQNRILLIGIHPSEAQGCRQPRAFYFEIKMFQSCTKWRN